MSAAGDKMHSARLNLSEYQTDKISNGYLRWYDEVLRPFSGDSVALLELGVFRGESLRMWGDYFPEGVVTGVDKRRPEGWSDSERVRFFEGSQADTEFLSKVAREVAPQGFDIIIDDASHIGRLSRVSFQHLFAHHLKPGGLYAIEDWGTGYWDDWSDGRSYRKPVAFQKLLAKLLQKLRLIPEVGDCHNHNFGMVGFIKELIDEQGAPDLLRKYHRNLHGRESMFECMMITPAIVFVKKPVD